MSEIPQQLEPIKINPEDINSPADYANSYPDAYAANPDREDVAQIQLKEARERASAEQAMGSALDNVFEQFAGSVVTNESGVEQLSMRMPFNGSRARVTLTRGSLDTEGLRTLTMAFEAKKAWSNALVYTDGPNKLPRLQAGTIDEQSGEATVYEGKSQEFNNRDPQIAHNGEIWLGNLSAGELTPVRASILPKVGHTVLGKLFSRS